MARQLITLNEVASRMRLSRQYIYDLLPDLLAAGLRRCKINSSTRWRYDEASLDRIIDKALERELPITNHTPVVDIELGKSTKNTVQEDL